MCPATAPTRCLCVRRHRHRTRQRDAAAVRPEPACARMAESSTHTVTPPETGTASQPWQRSAHSDADWWIMARHVQLRKRNQRPATNTAQDRTQRKLTAREFLSRRSGPMKGSSRPAQIKWPRLLRSVAHGRVFGKRYSAQESPTA